MKQYKPEKIGSVPNVEQGISRTLSEAKQRAKNFLKFALLASSLWVAQCGDDVAVAVPEQTPVVNVVVNKKEEPKFKLCPNPKNVDFREENKTVTMEQANLMKLENGVIVSLQDITVPNSNESGKAVLKLWYDGQSDKAKDVVLGVGESLTVVNPDGVEQVLECCSVIAGYTLAAKEAVFASDKSLQLIKNDVTPVKSTCDIPSKAINLSVEDLLTIGKSLPLDDGRKLVLKDIVSNDNPSETKVVINIVDGDGVLLKEASLDIKCLHDVSVNGKVYKVYIKEVSAGYTLDSKWAMIGVVSSVDSCWTSDKITVENSMYEMGYQGTDNTQYITNVWAQVGKSEGANCVDERKLIQQSSEFKYAIPFSDMNDRKKVMFIDKEMRLSKADARHVELVTERIYAQGLRIDESIDLGDGNVLVLMDIVSASGNSGDAVAIEIRSANGVLAKSVVSIDEGVASVGEYKIRVWEIARGYTVEERWASISVIDSHVVLRNGEKIYGGNSSGWDYWITPSIRTIDDALKGWEVGVTYKHQAESP